MHEIKLIALDLDGTLLNSRKELTSATLSALERADKAGIEIVPATGRFYGGMPEAVRRLPFIRYVISINGARVEDLRSGAVIYRAELPVKQAVDIMSMLDALPVIYDCYMDCAAWMSAGHDALVDGIVDSPFYRRMIHELRQNVPELKAFLNERGRDVQKVQLFTRDEALRRELLGSLGKRFPELAVSSSMEQNVEINNVHANKGEALLALTRHLGLPISAVMSLGDGLNDLSMLSAAGLGVAMGNACPEARAAADAVTASCDDDGVAKAIFKYCFPE